MVCPVTESVPIRIDFVPVQFALSVTDNVLDEDERRDSEASVSDAVFAAQVGDRDFAET